MTDTNAKAVPEDDKQKEPLASSDQTTTESTGGQSELNLGADFELDDDDMAMLFALGLC